MVTQCSTLTLNCVQYIVHELKQLCLSMYAKSLKQADRHLQAGYGVHVEKAHAHGCASALLTNTSVPYACIH